MTEMDPEWVNSERSGRYQLLGAVEGKTVSFTLWDGKLTVGALEENDIFIPVAAVSRHHAVFEVDGVRVLLRDTQSKNGTWLNGVRIAECEVSAGDTIAFGPVVFSVTGVDAGDDILGIVSDRRVSSLSSHHRADGDTGTGSRRASDQPPGWIDLLDEVASLVLSGSEHAIAGGLEALVVGLGASSGVLAELPRHGEPLVVAAAGQHIPCLDGLEVSFQLKNAREKAETSGGLSTFLADDAEPLAAAVAYSKGKETGLVLMVAGAFHRRIAAGGLLKLVMRMILARRPLVGVPTSQPARQGKPSDIVIPKDYVAGRSAAMLNVYRQIRQLQPGDIPVLITGETGAGKEHIARILHASSLRHDGPFVAVNCAAIPSELLEAELFGIERGVATGVDARKGKFQLAEGGTLFLDEIGDMSAALQAKLLRTLQEMEVHPLGARAPVPVDVRVISATNTDLQERIAERKFRRDLYFRIAGFPLHIPPLRERPDDIPLLVEYFLRRYAAEIGKPVRGVTVKALQLLTDAPWPGNVRELEHEVRRLVYLCAPNQVIDSSMASECVVSQTIGLDLDTLDLSSDLRLGTHLADLESKLIVLALARTKGNRSKAAKLLGISRNGLALKMERLGVG